MKTTFAWITIAIGILIVIGDFTAPATDAVTTVGVFTVGISLVVAGVYWRWKLKMLRRQW